jgi:uncharacterized membrane protein
MASVQESIDVAVPVEVAYEQWTHFEEFPTFMSAVKEVRRLDGSRLRWVAEIGGRQEEWDARITDQVPNERVAWASTSGASNAGVVTFQRLDGATTRVTVEMDHEANGILEKVGSALGVDDRQVHGDLERFRDMVESRGGVEGTRRGARATVDVDAAWASSAAPSGNVTSPADGGALGTGYGAPHRPGSTDGSA